MIVALAGRRIDPTVALPARFPLECVAAVRQRIDILFRDRHVTGLVCAAACGADLIALSVAGDLGLRRRVILPCAPERFRQSSVIDRPGDWGSLFDRVIDDVASNGDLVVLSLREEGRRAYEATNLALVEEAQAIARAEKRKRNDPDRQESPSVLAVVVWEGTSRGAGDVTAHFLEQAKILGLEIVEVPTI